MNRRLSVVVSAVLVLSLVFFLLVLFPPGLKRYNAQGGAGPGLSGISIPADIADDLYRLLGPVVGVKVYSRFGVSEQTILLAPHGVVGVVPGIHQEPSTVFEMSDEEYFHWSRRASELVMGQKPKAIYVDAVVSFLFDVKVKPFWKKAGLVVLATRFAV